MIVSWRYRMFQTLSLDYNSAAHRWRQKNVTPTENQTNIGHSARGRKSARMENVPDLLFDCFRVLECAKMRTVLQSSFLATWSLSKKQSVLRFLSGFLTFILWLRLLFQGSLSPSYILPSCNACCLPYPDKNTRNNQCFDSTLLKRAYKAFEWEEKFVWVMRGGLIRRRLFLESVRGAITRTRVVWRWQRTNPNNPSTHHERLELEISDACMYDLDKAIAEVSGTFDGVEAISAEEREGIENYNQRRDILAVLPTG